MFLNGRMYVYVSVCRSDSVERAELMMQERRKD